MKDQLNLKVSALIIIKKHPNLSKTLDVSHYCLSIDPASS